MKRERTGGNVMILFSPVTCLRVIVLCLCGTLTGGCLNFVLLREAADTTTDIGGYHLIANDSPRWANELKRHPRVYYCDNQWIACEVAAEPFGDQVQTTSGLGVYLIVIKNPVFEPATGSPSHSAQEWEEGSTPRPRPSNERMTVDIELPDYWVACAPEGYSLGKSPADAEDKIFLDDELSAVMTTPLPLVCDCEVKVIDYGEVIPYVCDGRPVNVTVTVKAGKVVSEQVHGKVWWFYALLPVTVPFDIVTAPLTAIFVIVVLATGNGP
jgi:hypothetical protein